jgi:hypothetical protein
MSANDFELVLKIVGEPDALYVEQIAQPEPHC